MESATSKISEIYRAQSWKFLERKVKMIKLELNCMKEIYEDFIKLVELKLKNEQSKIKLIKKIDSLEKTNVKTIGFFKVKTKQE